MPEVDKKHTDIHVCLSFTHTHTHTLTVHIHMRNITTDYRNINTHTVIDLSDPELYVHSQSSDETRPHSTNFSIIPWKENL